MSASESQIAKLPKWASDHIRALQNERDIAIRELNEWVDGQTESPVYIDELVSIGEDREDGRNPPTFKRRYIQTKRISIRWQGILFEVILRDDHLDLSWGDEARAMTHTAFIPKSYQQAEIRSKGHMR